MVNYLPIFDNGHGFDTLGKKSIMPNGEIFEEWEFTRIVKLRAFSKLHKKGIDFHDLVPEAHDVPLTERINREHNIYYGTKNSLLISIHADAFTDSDANGLTVFSCRGQTGADPIQDLFVDELKDLGLFNRYDVDSDGYKGREADFAMVKRTKSKAILLELGFYTSPHDVVKINNSEFQEKIADCLVSAIINSNKFFR